MAGESVARCPESVIVPIIFIPGIMGSRLRKTNDKTDIVWEPGEGSWDETWNALGLARRGLEGKRRRIVGPPEQYFDRNFLEVAHQGNGGMEDRGHSGLLAGYLPFVNWLNTMQLVRIDGCLVMADFRVWAHPYNWSASNLDSARYKASEGHRSLEETIAMSVAEAEHHASRMDATYNVLKPLIVTHSMGGLVSRAFTEVMGKGDLVHGVVHGALPCHGSTELYKRIRGGFEGGTSWVLGRNSGQVTATAGNCPGPLELAPNKWHQGVDGRYDWLGISDALGQTQTLPHSDPYSEIYRNETEYWRMIQKHLLNPEGDPGGDRAFIKYIEQLSRAEAFHDTVGRNGFHPNTRMFYGTGITTRDRVDWSLGSHIGALPPDGSFNTARIDPNGPDTGSIALTSPEFGGRNPYEGYIAIMEMSGPNAPGDETVQAGSGIHSGQMAVAVTDGFSHQAAFDSFEARHLTLDWLLEMTEEMIVGS